MKSTINQTNGSVDTSVVSNAIRQSHNINAVPRLRADWNLNRYVIPTADNTPLAADDSFDADTFPISSIIEPNRPNKGAAKAIVGQSVVSGKYTSQTDAHFYIGDDEDKYKYWLSPDTTDSSGNFPLHTDSVTTCRPYVLYPRVLKANKIVVKLENTWATPKTFRIRSRSTVYTSGTLSWTTIATSPTINNADGTITLYYNGTGWTTTRPATLVAANIAGLQLAVDSMGGGFKKDGTATTYLKRTGGTGPLTQYTTDGKNSNCAVIAIEAHFEADLTNRLESVTDTFDMGEVDQLYPLGTITTNVSQITLDNGDSIFNNENVSSDYYKILEPNVEFNMEYIYTVSGTKYAVQQFKMYGGIWSGQYTDSVSLQLDDYSKFLKETKPRPTMYENKTAPELVWRLLDSVGFTDYVIDESDIVTDNVIPVFWIDGEQTVWEVLDGLAKATQTAIYFDAYGKLQVKTREAAFNDAKTPSATLYGQVTSGNLTNIESLDSSDDLAANNIDVKYKNTKWKVGTYGDPAMSKVWEPEDETLTVRSAPLRANLSTNATMMYLNGVQSWVWPYASKVNINGEILSYEGKEYIYYTYDKVVNGTSKVVSYTNPVKHVVKVKNLDEQNSFNALTPAEYQSKNYLTGGLFIKERGLWNTVPANHTVDASGWTTASEHIRNDGGTIKTPTAIFSQNALYSLGTITTSGYMRDAADTSWVHRGFAADTAFKRYGTHMRFRNDAARPTQRGGIGFCLNGVRNHGYYVELRPTSTITTKDAEIVAEVMIYSRKNGKYATVANGARVAIVAGRFYDVDVTYAAGTQDTISVWLNGQMVAKGTTNSDTKQPSGGKYAMYTRGKTVADYEYFYGFNTNAAEPADDFGYYDLIYGGMRSSYWIREAVYQLKTRVKKVNKKNVTINYKLNDYIFDEFGPYVHEIREFDVKFEPKPVQYSTIFNTNSWYSAVIDYRSTPFGAKFTIANVARGNAIIHGEDTLIFNSAENAVQQVCTVLGRDLEIANEEIVNAKNPEAIRKHGQIDVELSSDWLQTKAMAESVSTWMGKHWSEGLDTLSVTIFGNPLIEIGDIVAVDYDRKGMDPSTHKYFVTGTSSSFENGIETNLTLRRVRTSEDVVVSP